MSSSSFNQEWSATCPKCDKNITPDMVKCTNCGKGRVLSKFGDREASTFGCDFCDVTVGALSCPSCGASISKKFIQVYRNEEAEAAENENKAKKASAVNARLADMAEEDMRKRKRKVIESLYNPMTKGFWWMIIVYWILINALLFVFKIHLGDWWMVWVNIIGIIYTFSRFVGLSARHAAPRGGPGSY